MKVTAGSLQAEVRRLLGRDDVVPGMVAAIQRGILDVDRPLV